jgi:hypothetical protein
MAYKTFLKYHHKCDIYSRTITTNAAGQKVGSFSVSNSSTPCFFQTVASERRVAPYVDNVDEFELIIPHPYVTYLSYGGRVQNIVDRYSNVIESGPFEIIEISKRTGFNGKVNHALVRIRLIVEVGS